MLEKLLINICACNIGLLSFSRVVEIIRRIQASKMGISPLLSMKRIVFVLVHFVCPLV